ncbi:uncharacterized protein AB675_5290 [Cyphellophora attinorum]|uniref:DNA2/NAM7 helicase helicase domain-containing protein n=1 Tax=Cyphellophora attinorum TaxID=1664694 RepID=A0A0N0NNN9_9EURO|nr:uncharacterized protein AB675_5290 [Phialophora attinorum]KPI41811.1 hypothetical protein AB675_5290 [Phialophora attinorum]
MEPYGLGRLRKAMNAKLKDNDEPTFKNSPPVVQNNTHKTTVARFAHNIFRYIANGERTFVVVQDHLKEHHSQVCAAFATPNKAIYKDDKNDATRKSWLCKMLRIAPSYLFANWMAELDYNAAMRLQNLLQIRVSNENRPLDIDTELVAAARAANTSTKRTRSVWDLSLAERQQLYDKWVKEITLDAIRDRFVELVFLLKRCERRENYLGLLSDANAFESLGKNLVACTASFAIQNFKLINTLSPSVLLIDEGGLWPYIAQLCMFGIKSLQQMHLVGAHVQLGYRPTQPALGRPPYNLAISYMEEMHHNELSNTTSLDVQHRVEGRVHWGDNSLPQRDHTSHGQRKLATNAAVAVQKDTFKAWVNELEADMTLKLSSVLRQNGVEVLRELIVLVAVPQAVDGGVVKAVTNDHRLCVLRLGKQFRDQDEMELFDRSACAWT